MPVRSIRTRSFWWQSSPCLLYTSLLEPYEDPENSNVTVGFNKEVTLENGIYFNDSFQAVSYTHLDVYKRQPTRSSVFCAI